MISTKNILILSSILVVFVLILGGGCKKKDTGIALEYGTVTDIDGNVYNTIKINNRWWMAENLKTKRYRNGDSVEFVREVNFQLDSVKWKNNTTGAYCIIDNAYETAQNYSGKLFGFLYNFYAVSAIIFLRKPQKL